VKEPGSEHASGRTGKGGEKAIIFIGLPTFLHCIPYYYIFKIICLPQFAGRIHIFSFIRTFIL